MKRQNRHPILTAISATFCTVLLSGWGACDININLPEEPTDPEPLACQVHSDCLEDQICINGLCAEDTDPPPPPPPHGCVDDSECGADQVCDLVETCLPCDAPPGADCALECSIEGTCIDIEPPPPPPEECYSDADCGDGFYCEFGDYAQPYCGDDEDCNDLTVEVGMCIPDEGPICGYDMCPPGHECVEMYECWDECWEAEDGTEGCDAECYPYIECVPTYPNEECYSDADCGDGFYCEYWDYYPEPACDDANDPDCGGAGLVAPAGVCVPEWEPEPGCQADSDCPGGMICQIQEYCTGACPGYDPDTGEEPADCYEECFVDGFCTYPEEPDHCADLPAAFCEDVEGCHLEEIWTGCDSTQPVDDNGDAFPMPPCDEEPVLICVADDPTPPVQCYENADCGPGYVCELYEACPAIACPPDAEDCEIDCFVEGQCVPDYGQGSCENACGGASMDGSCFCDEVCMQYGDCCDDFADVCEDMVQPCNTDDECTEGMVCRADTGHCGYPDPTFCELDADCEEGQVCEHLYLDEPVIDENGNEVDPDLLPAGICVDVGTPPLPPPPTEPGLSCANVDCADGYTCVEEMFCLDYCDQTVEDPECCQIEVMCVPADGTDPNAP